MKRIAACLVSLMLLLVLTDNTKAEAAPDIPQGYQLIAESQVLALYYSQNERSIVVEDKRNGFIWRSSVGDDEYDIKSLNPMLSNSTRSLFNFTYADLTNDKGVLTQTNSLSEKSEVSVKAVDNGLSMSYNFTELGIEITVEIFIDGDAMEVSVPIDGVKEKSNLAVVRIEVLPYFGAANDHRNGYIFYPDGSGALLNFKENHPGRASKYQWYIYGSDTVDIDEYERMEDSGLQQAMLPVFGLKRDDNAFVAIVADGEYDTAVNLYPSGFAINLNRISAEFTYRRLYRATQPDATLLLKVDRDRVNADHTVRYVFLSDNQADYSGMAAAYRQYLLDNAKIKDTIKEGDAIPLALDLLTGIKEDRLLFDKFIAMTTFDQAGEIVDQFAQSGVEDMMVNLIGWTKEGYGTYPVHLPPNRVLGGYDGLERLAEYTQSNDIKLYLEDNFVDAYSDNGGFSERNDVVHQKIGLVVTNRLSDRFIFNPIVAFNNFVQQFLPDIRRVGISGLNFDRFGSLIYFDYLRGYEVTRQQTAEQWNKFMEQSAEQFGSSAVRGGNAYVLKEADWLLDIPVADSGYFITDEVVPFYQMVVHGLLPYSSEPGNLFYDPDRQKLKWVEYGYMPYYRLTYQNSELLKYTDFNQLFTSYYSDWIETAAQTYSEFNQRLGDTWSQYMVKHERLSRDVYKVTYQNGVKVYINYSEQPTAAEGINIKALDYSVVDERGVQK